MGCSNVNLIEGDAGKTVSVLFDKEMNAYDA